MKLFQRTAIAGGLALIAGSAHATLSTTDFTFGLYDATSGFTFAADLGLATSALGSLPGTYNYTADTSYQTFASHIGASDTLEWTVVARQVTPATLSLGSTALPPSVPGISSTVSTSSALAFVNSFIGGMNSGTATLNAAGTTSVSNGTTIATGDMAFLLSDFNTSLGESTDLSAAPGTVMDLWQMTGAAPGTLNSTGLTMSYGSGVLTISAVPEPSSWALMGLGLLGMGFIVRRRTSL